MSEASESYLEELKKEIARNEADKKALVEEFEKIAADEWSPEDLRDKFRELVPQAWAQLGNLMNHAESESVRANLIKFVFDKAMDQSPEEDQSVNSLIAKLTANKAE